MPNEGAKPLPVTPAIVQNTVNDSVNPLKEEVASLEKDIESIQKTHNKYLFERKMVTAVMSYYAPDLLQTFLPLPDEVNWAIRASLYLGMDKATDLLSEHFTAILDSIKTKLTQL